MSFTNVKFNINLVPISPFTTQYQPDYVYRIPYLIYPDFNSIYSKLRDLGIPVIGPISYSPIPFDIFQYNSLNIKFNYYYDYPVYIGTDETGLTTVITPVITSTYKALRISRYRYIVSTTYNNTTCNSTTVKVITDFITTLSVGSNIFNYTQTTILITTNTSVLEFEVRTRGQSVAIDYSSNNVQLTNIISISLKIGVKDKFVLTIPILSVSKQVTSNIADFFIINEWTYNDVGFTVSTIFAPGWPLYCYPCAQTNMGFGNQTEYTYAKPLPSLYILFNYANYKTNVTIERPIQILPSVYIAPFPSCTSTDCTNCAYMSGIAKLNDYITYTTLLNSTFRFPVIKNKLSNILLQYIFMHSISKQLTIFCKEITKLVTTLNTSQTSSTKTSSLLESFIYFYNYASTQITTFRPTNTTRITSYIFFTTALVSTLLLSIYNKVIEFDNQSVMFYLSSTDRNRMYVELSGYLAFWS